jgi:hypothetical protein
LSKNKKISIKGDPIDKAIEVIELRGDESEDDIESIRVWVESSYSKNEITFDEYFDFKQRLIKCEVKKLEKKYHVKCCISIKRKKHFIEEKKENYKNKIVGGRNGNSRS